MNHRLAVAVLVLGLTTTGALCADETAEPAPLAGNMTPPPGPSTPNTGTAPAGNPKTSGSAETGPAQSVGADGLREHSGSLESGDATLNSGEYADTYTVDVQEGQTIFVDLRATGDFDPYIIVRAPSGEQFENDDYEGDRTRSRVEEVAGESGAWRVIATSFEPGETGNYDITIRTGAGSGSGSSGGGK